MLIQRMCNNCLFVDSDNNMCTLSTQQKFYTNSLQLSCNSWRPDTINIKKSKLQFRIDQHINEARYYKDCYKSHIRQAEELKKDLLKTGELK